MKNMSSFVVLICALLFSSTLLADPHTVTYDKKTRSAGTMLDFGGQPHVIVRIPVKDYVSNDRYSVMYAAPLYGGLITTGLVTTTHTPDNFVANMQIDSFPAYVQIFDSLSYSLTGDGLGGNDFIVYGSITISVSINLGSSVLTITDTLDLSDPDTGLPPLTSSSTGASLNAVPNAEWRKYKDPVNLVNELDKWIDYVRIIPE